MKFKLFELKGLTQLLTPVGLVTHFHICLRTWSFVKLMALYGSKPLHETVPVYCQMDP